MLVVSRSPMKATRLGLLAAFVLLALVPTDLPAQSSPSSSATPGDVAAPGAQTSPLSSAQLHKIVKSIKDGNKRAVLNQNLTNLLGLTKNGEVLTLPYRAIKDDSGVHQVFFLLVATTGYLIVQRDPRDTQNAMVVYVDSDLHLISAVSYPNSHPDLFSPVPRPEAAKTLNEELLWWAEFTDQHITDE